MLHMLSPSYVIDLLFFNFNHKSILKTILELYCLETGFPAVHFTGNSSLVKDSITFENSLTLLGQFTQF